ncbi:cupin domain-containing protein [Metabacillus fastidiosus]|uniref:cupin domain-containing protein n=1 Tax=Metabacillus fastidiosus TaxID=1458 RepID=UPI002E1B99B4|nr:cupin domain-containing protein [Metabacillus fastidiosus]
MSENKTAATIEEIMKERVFEVDKIAKFSSEQAQKNFFYETERTVGAIWCLEPGQDLYVHSHSAVDDIWVCIQGEGVYYPDLENEIPIKAGMILLAKPNQIHGMLNTGTENFMFVGFACGDNPATMDITKYERTAK